jgi:hypothetical protein
MMIFGNKKCKEQINSVFREAKDKGIKGVYEGRNTSWFQMAEIMS